MEHKIHSKFDKKIWEERIKELEELKVTGVVFYTDGGMRNVKFKPRSGWGIHCYFLNDDKPDGIGGFKLDYPTRQGYKPKKEAGKEGAINVVKINNMFGNCGSRTNQVAELEGFLQAAYIYIETGLYKLSDTLVIRTDSKYVKDGILDYMPNWVKNEWRKADGSTVKNLMYWKEIRNVVEVLNSLGCTLDIDWVKGHMDYGNLIADRMATLGLFSDSEYSEEYVGTKLYNSPSLEFCPLLIDSKLLYDPSGEVSYRNGLFHYYTYTNANSTDDLHDVGRNLIDSSICFIATEQDQFLLNELREICDELTNKSEIGKVPMFIDMNIAPKPKNQIELSNATSLPLVIGKKDIKLETTEEKTLITVLNPPRCSKFMMDRIRDLMAVNKAHEVGGDKTIIETDITSELFDTELNGKGVTKYKFKVNEDLSIDVKAPIWKEAGVKDHKFTLTFGLDLPRRRVFSNIKDLNPKVSILTWYENEEISCFATIVRIDGAYGVWTAEQTNTERTGAFNYDK